MLYREGVVKPYGIAIGPLCHQLSDTFHMERGTDAIGIVMKFEAGRSLEQYIFNNGPINGTEKIRIIESIARALTEIHALGR